MKSEERHELKENDLVGWMNQLPIYARLYGSYVLFAIALVLLGYQVFRWYEREQERKLESAWSELTDASGAFGARAAPDPAKLRTVIAKYDNQPIQALAYVALGDYYAETVNLGEAPGDSKVTITTDQANQEALNAYQKVIADYSDQPLALVRARLGLGRIYENLGQWDKARAQYQAVLDDKTSRLADSAFAAEARRRIDRLADWQRPVRFGPPVPEARTSPLPGLPGLPTSLPALGPIGPG
jgi:tetratricopeptide (TPR) repeat protein